MSIGQPLSTNNPRLLKLLDCFYTQSPSYFLDHNLMPYVCIEQAQQSFLRVDLFNFTKGDFSYAKNDKTLPRDIQFWTGICRFLYYTLKCFDDNSYGNDFKLDIKYSLTNQIKKIWHIDYNQYIGQVIITANSSLRNDGASFKSEVKNASMFAFDTLKDMLIRLKTISSEEAYRKMALTIVVDCAF